jgi:signal transduction histidine kinase
MFAPFSTTKAAGSGLGPPLAREIVEGHGGSLSCESDPERGTVFTVAIPRC